MPSDGSGCYLRLPFRQSNAAPQVGRLICLMGIRVMNGAIATLLY